MPVTGASMDSSGWIGTTAERPREHFRWSPATERLSERSMMPRRRWKFSATTGGRSRCRPAVRNLRSPTTWRRISARPRPRIKKPGTLENERQALDRGRGVHRIAPDSSLRRSVGCAMSTHGLFAKALGWSARQQTSIGSVSLSPSLVCVVLRHGRTRLHDHRCMDGAKRRGYSSVRSTTIYSKTIVNERRGS